MTRQKQQGYVKRSCLFCIFGLLLFRTLKLIIIPFPFADDDDARILLTQESALSVEEERRKNATSSTSASDSTPNNNVFYFRRSNNNTKIHHHRPPACTDDQLKIVMKQLRPERCVQFRKRPYLQQCSFTEATKCPDPIWLHEFHRNRSGTPSFLSYFIGCNKAIDAVNALRMGSHNASVDVLKWQQQLQKSGTTFDKSSCAQFDKRQVDIPINTEVNDAQVHCIEPMTKTFAELNRTKHDLAWGDELVLVHGAFSSNPGNLTVSRLDGSQTAGTENLDINEISNVCSDQKTVQPDVCMSIPIMTIDEYHRQHDHDKVHYVSIDVEGFDAKVLRGGMKTLRNHVQYVEFEYNWKGPWAETSLSSVLSSLERIGFTCYWPGTNGNIWRITGCWLEHYDIRFWSNVACVNENDKDAAPLLARMEELFLQTLQKDDVEYI